MLYEPGFWLLASIAILGLSPVVGAALARPSFRRLNEIAREVMNNPEATAADRAWLLAALTNPHKRWPLWLGVLLAPVWTIFGIVWAINLLRDKSSPAERSDAIDQETTVALAGADPTSGALWNSALRREALDVSTDADMLSNPLLTGWVLFWGILPAALVLTVGGKAISTNLLIRKLFDAGSWPFSSHTA